MPVCGRWSAAELAAVGRRSARNSSRLWLEPGSVCPGQLPPPLALSIATVSGQVDESGGPTTSGARIPPTASLVTLGVVGEPFRGHNSRAAG